MSELTTPTKDVRAHRRVVVTGIGAVTPAGLTFAETWNNVLEGRSSGRKITLFDAAEMPCGIGYEVEGFTFDPNLISGDEDAFTTRATLFALTATREALEQAGAQALDTADPFRKAVCLGVGVPSTDFKWFSEVFCAEQWDHPSLAVHAKHFPYMLTSMVSRLANAQAGNFTIHTACASSGQGLGEAFEMIQDGSADVVITGGADSMINPLHIAGFNLLGALATRFDDPSRASRPFDVNRNGFVMGEGACILIFEELEHALARGARILGEVCGYGVTESAYRITDLHPEGTGPIEAMEMAIAEAGIAKHQVGYINAHGTSTLLNDAIESLAIRKVFGTDSMPKVSSTKSVTGHLISAAGAIEFAFCLKAIADRVLPPSSNLDRQDPVCEVPLTASRPEASDFDFALSNSVGFGGSNTALVAGRYQP